MVLRTRRAATLAVLAAIGGISPAAFGRVDIQKSGPVTTWTVAVDGIKFEKVTIAGKTFERAKLAGVDGYEGVIYEVGSPEVPVVRFYAEGNVKVRVGESTRAGQLATGALLVPNQPSHEKSPGKTPAFAFNSKAYMNTMSLSESPYTIEDAGSINGVPRKLVTLKPFVYDAASGAWTLRQGFSVTSLRPSSKRDALNKEIFAMMVGPKFQGSVGVTEYSRLKTRLGYEVVIKDVSTSDTADTLRAWVKNVYARSDAKLTNLLVVGDAGDVPSKAAGNISGVTDHYYRAIDTDDYESDINGPDIGVGRITASNVAEMDKIFAKLQRYTTGTFGASRWLESVAFLATDDRWEVAEGTHNYAIQTYTAPRAYSGVFPNANQVGGDQLYAITHRVSDAKVVEVMGMGRTIINYSGHGSTTSWAGPNVSQADVRSLRDPDALPFVISNACITGDFRIAESFGETWIRHEFGAVAFWGSMDSSYWDEDDILERRMYDSIYRDGKLNFADHTNFALAEVWKAYGGAGKSKYYWETYVLFGDPSLDLRTEPVRQISVEGPGVVPVGLGTVSYDVSDARGAVAGARVAVTTTEGAVVASGYTGADGRVTLDLGEAGMTTSSLKVSVSGKNTALAESNLDVIPADEPFFAFNAWTLNGRTGLTSYPEERVLLGFRVANLGNKPTNGGRLTIESVDGPATVVGQSFALPALPAGANAVINTTGLGLKILRTANSGDTVRLKLNWQSNEGQASTVNAVVKIARANVAVVSTDFGTAGSQDGGIRPGATGDVYVTVTNTGSETISTGSLTASPGACVDQVTGEAPVVNLAPGASMRLATPFAVTISASCHSGDVAKLEIGGSYQSIAAQLSLAAQTSFTAGVMSQSTTALDGINLAIPDKEAVVQTIAVESQGSLREIGLYLNLQHSYIGDLKITLRHPDGTEAVVWGRAGGSGDAIQQTFGLGGTPLDSFAAFAGKPAQGNWTLSITDEATSDTGTLNDVRLTVRGYLD